jgi:acyl carrier protein
MTDTAARVRSLISEYAGISIQQLADEARFDDIGFDSLDRLELTMALEEEFSIEVADDKIELVNTIGEAVGLVERELSQGRG